MESSLLTSTEPGHDSNAMLQIQMKRIITENQIKQDGIFDSPFFLGDLGKIKKQIRKWKTFLSRVEMFYAVKCCSELPVLKFLVDMNVSFDCASQKEIETILDLGADATQILFANTIKSVTSLRYACDNNITLMTFDNEEELEKIKRYCPDARLVLRLRCKMSSHVVFNFGMKYGCSLEKVRVLLNKAKSLQLPVVGVSFHVGCGVTDGSIYTKAIRQAHTVFQMGESEGFNFNMLDIGGGFSGHEGSNCTFEKAETTLKEAEFIPYISPTTTKDCEI